eukprot:CAMPEP_0119392322 /NCGR_PEP_ID=MMETSP1334-20130426/120702_1 /TAXON_ID=127549 /ORGANISM="Calcidiscus leptoporus, Strain RCC1130" /LENGTH=118 /DNA_ID=CAMNT_0007415163 /DNA_START=163 /DNA_END=517 /DNA_ORIENTATION=-
MSSSTCNRCRVKADRMLCGLQWFDTFPRRIEWLDSKTQEHILFMNRFCELHQSFVTLWIGPFTLAPKGSLVASGGLLSERDEALGSGVLDSGAGGEAAAGAAATSLSPETAVPATATR